MKRIVSIVIVVVALSGAGLLVRQLGVEQNQTTSNPARLAEEVQTFQSSVQVSSIEANASEYEMQIASLEAERSNHIYLISDLEAKLSDAEIAIKNYENETTKLESQISALEEEKVNYESHITQLEEDLTDAETTIDDNKAKASKLESQISDLESKIIGLRTTLSSYEEEIASLNSLVEYYESETTSLQDIIDSQDSQIFEVTQHYEWVYGSWLWSDRYQWDLTIPLSLYCEYYERPRPASWRDWVDIAKDHYDDPYIDEMFQKMNQVALSEGFTEAQKINFVIAFVQSLPYTVDMVTTPWNEYPRYPIETLFDRGGDCEDTSILVAALLDRMGYDVALLFLYNENHCAVGVSIDGSHGSYYQYDDKKYFYLETTGDGWQIGEIPPDFTETIARIYPLHP
jgi:predicted  nucleic acid-binding Zn-ribbon protein